MKRDDHRYRIRAGARRLMGTMLVLAAVGAGAGCGPRAKKVEPLSNVVRLYNEDVRWQRFGRASLHLPPAQRGDFLDQRDQLHEDLRIHHYQVVRVRYGPQGLRARVHVKYTWYLDSRGVVNESHAVQRWQRRDGPWRLVGEVRLRGAPMPGLAEPEEPPAEPASDSPAELSDDPTVAPPDEPTADLPDALPQDLPAESP